MSCHSPSLHPSYRPQRAQRSFRMMKIVSYIRSFHASRRLEPIETCFVRKFFLGCLTCGLNLDALVSRIRDAIANIDKCKQAPCSCTCYESVFSSLGYICALGIALIASCMRAGWSGHSCRPRCCFRCRHWLLDINNVPCYNFPIQQCV